jgi:hypothetical protein
MRIKLTNVLRGCLGTFLSRRNAPLVTTFSNIPENTFTVIAVFGVQAGGSRRAVSDVCHSRHSTESSLPVRYATRIGPAQDASKGAIAPNTFRGTFRGHTPPAWIAFTKCVFIGFLVRPA